MALSGTLSALCFLALALYILAGAAVRLLFHKLSAFPGPPLAALTSWYHFYYDIIKHGGWLRHQTELHMKYGMYFACFSPNYYANLLDG